MYHQQADPTLRLNFSHRLLGSLSPHPRPYLLQAAFTIINLIEIFISLQSQSPDDRRWTGQRHLKAFPAPEILGSPNQASHRRCGTLYEPKANASEHFHVNFGRVGLVIH